MRRDHLGALRGFIAALPAAIAALALPPAARGAATEAPGAAAVRQRALPDQLRSVGVASRDGVVVTRNAAASWAGTRMLELGGNAVDAAVAAAFALGVAEPGSCGLGGQTYILIRMSDGHAVAVDGSARSPLRASAQELARMRDPIPAGKFLEGYKSVATPGSLAGLDLALRTYGTRSLAEAVAPAIEIAEFGSTWSAALHAFINNYSTKVRSSAYLSRLFLTESLDVWDPGHVYCNPDLACFLRRLAAAGADDFYRGSIAAEIEQDMIANGGWLRRSDLSLLEATVREPVRGSYRGLEVLSFPYPGGGSTVVETLGILDRFDPEVLREDSVDRLHLLVDAGRIAMIDTFPARRPLRLPDQIAVDPAHLDVRAALIRFDRALKRSEISSEPLSAIEVAGTSHVSVADRFGNAVALTQTLGASFGGGAVTVGFGFAYNNLIHGFEFRNRGSWAYFRPLQAPMTNMAPTIVVKDGAPLLILGTAGTAHIAPAIVSVISGVIDQRLPLCEAVAKPRALWGGNVGEEVSLECVDPITDDVADALAARGFVQQTRLTYPATAYDRTEYGSVNAVFIDPADGTIVGVGDPRRQCVARAVDRHAGATPPFALPGCWRGLYALPGTQQTAGSGQQ
jgi:gamma-glutamyltranspeptidase/glutathione hydrolase